MISLGVTADSYIVFFERLKDEVRSGKSARSAVQPAFKRSYKTIVAADFVTMIAAVVLYVTAVSSVRGFALTLGVATLLDLFVVYFFKRPTVFLIARNERLVNMHGFGLRSGIAGDPEPDRDAGGRHAVNLHHAERDLSRPHDPALPVHRAQAVVVHDLRRRHPARHRGLHRPRWLEPVDRLRGRRADLLPVAVGRHRGRHQRHPRRQRPSRRRGADRRTATRSRSAPRPWPGAVEADALISDLAKQAGVTVTEVSIQDIGPTWGAEISRKALFGLVIVLIAIMLYISFRFEWKMAVGRHHRAAPRRTDHDRRLRVDGPRGHARDRHRHPHDPRVLAVRHRRDLRQDPGEHRVQRAGLQARLRRRGRPVAEPDLHALGEHLAGRSCCRSCRCCSSAETR